ncbi:sigma 54-interacting transcriptional regulator [Desulfococcus sp.]|uniref:sigma 54-interacting transcriptional regulator n=1 Tax=Desulfococcus sp. TaxID=2025834 RepID=UPI0035947F59
MQNEELRRAQTELDASRARYFGLYDLAPVGYCTLSEKGRILEVNLTAATLLNVARGTLVGQPITRFIHKEDQDIHYLHNRQLFEVHSAILQGRVQAGMEQTVERQEYELRMVKNDGTSFWAHLAATAAQDDAGAPVCRVVMNDITYRRRMEEALQNAHDKLEHQVEERTAELAAAMQAAEKGRLNAEAALVEIQKLKDQLEAEKAYLIEEIKLENNHENIIGQSDGIQFVLSQVEQIAGRETTILVLGETGTGKELVVRAIHGLSRRKNRALVKVNCAALHANLIESELFGHEKGAFTGAQTRRLGRFEIAHGATLFLDEIGELPLELQAKLLRVLQDGEFERLGGSSTIKVDVRMIAATNRNLEEEVRKGRFREDLWYRLNVFPITIPPLRDRMEDIPLLVDFYVQKISKRMGKTIEMIPANAMSALQRYHWPGNIRELENVLERAVINSSGTKLRLADELNNPSTGPGIRQKTLEAVERDHIVQTLEQTCWKVAGKNSAAEILGIDPGALRARMRELDIRKK